jgi:hypothetical protein
MSDPNDPSSTGDGASLISSTFLEFCTMVPNNDPTLLPEHGKPFKIDSLSEREGIEPSKALPENTNITYLQLETAKYTKSSADAMAKYVRTSKRLQHIQLSLPWMSDDLALQRQLENMLCCFLPAFQESTSLQELHMQLPRGDGPSSLALENMSTHTQSLWSLSLNCVGARPEDIAVAALLSGLKKKTLYESLH